MSGQPPSSPAQPGAPRVPTAQECNFLVAIVKNSDGVTNIDWEAVASEAGYNNAATARVRFGQVKKALGWTVQCVGSKGSPIKSPIKVEKKTAKPRVRKTKTMIKKQEEALSQAVDDDSSGHEQDGANVRKQEDENDHKQEREVVKPKKVDEDEDTMVEEEYTSADDFA
ncbi:hypothetical protein V493_06957 [Pseudogymnoascus sp. VKM F-4281 (FW-2241)]|nr:hypothetical protein V493_06957 [Pseudogymnoascus sp. VKM F-4281 (FW-2241)]